MVLPSRRFSLAETFCLAFVQTTQPCGTHPGCRALPSLHPPHRERIPRRASGAAPARQWKSVHKTEWYIKNSNNKKSRIPWFLFWFVCWFFLQPPTPKLSLIQTTMSTVWKHRPKLLLCRAARRKRLKKFSLWQKDSSNYTQCPQGAQILVCGNSDSSHQPRIERAVNNSDCTEETTVVSWVFHLAWWRGLLPTVTTPTSAAVTATESEVLLPINCRRAQWKRLF